MDWQHPVSLDDLKPFLREHWEGADALWEVIERPGPKEVIEKIARIHWNQKDRASDFGRGKRFDNDLELRHEVLLRIVTTAISRSGFQGPPRTEEIREPRHVLYKIVDRVTSDVFKAGYATDEVTAKALTSDGNVDPEGEAVAPEVRLVSEQRLREGVTRDFLETDSLPALSKLVYLVCESPGMITPEIVSEAVAESSGSDGLARGADETWTLLQQWDDLFGEESNEHPSKRYLAWVLRSTNSVSPESWRAGDPDAMTRALDAVRKWKKRACDLVREFTMRVDSPAQAESIRILEGGGGA